MLFIYLFIMLRFELSLTLTGQVLYHLRHSEPWLFLEMMVVVVVVVVMGCVCVCVCVCVGS
jgi:hypothetical protein